MRIETDPSSMKYIPSAASPVHVHEYVMVDEKNMIILIVAIKPFQFNFYSPCLIIRSPLLNVFGTSASARFILS